MPDRLGLFGRAGQPPQVHPGLAIQVFHGWRGGALQHLDLDSRVFRHGHPVDDLDRQGGAMEARDLVAPAMLAQYLPVHDAAPARLGLLVAHGDADALIDAERNAHVRSGHQHGQCRRADERAIPIELHASRLIRRVFCVIERCLQTSRRLDGEHCAGHQLGVELLFRHGIQPHLAIGCDAHAPRNAVLRDELRSELFCGDQRSFVFRLRFLGRAE